MTERTITLPLDAVVGIIEAMVYWHRRSQFRDWTPTPDNINALPPPLKDYICHIETLCDPAGMVAENTLLKDQTRQLDAMIARLKSVINQACDVYTGDFRPESTPEYIARRMYEIIGEEATDE